MKISVDTTLRQIKEYPPFSEFKELLFSNCLIPDWEDSLTGLQQRCPDWNAEDIVYGLQRLVNLMNVGVPVYQKFESAGEGIGLFFMPGRQGAPFALICPGGGYQAVCTLKEGFTTGAKLNEMGYNAFVLCYHVKEEGVTRKALEDLRNAIRFILENAEKFEAAKTGYAVFGYSSGGHLAAEWGTRNHGFLSEGMLPPAAIVLAYPATDLKLLEEDAGGKRLVIGMLGSDYRDKDIEEYNIGDQMTNEFPPTYLWHCQDDPIIPFATSVRLAERLEEHRCRYKMHIYAHGGHGIGLGTGLEPEGWIKEAVTFWEKADKI